MAKQKSQRVTDSDVGSSASTTVASVGITQMVEGYSDDFIVVSSITSWRVHDQLLILKHQWTTSHGTHQCLSWEISILNGIFKGTTCFLQWTVDFFGATGKLNLGITFVIKDLSQTDTKMTNMKCMEAAYALRWFCWGCSSAQLGLLPCPIGQGFKNVTARRQEKHENTQNCKKKTKKLLDNARTALTSPASCWKTFRNCLSSSLSFCSAYTAGLRGGGFITQEIQLNLTEH